MRLGVNLDHVCTLRQARYRGEEGAFFAEPRVVEAARLAEKSGADQITVHLREDRRHLQDRDLIDLKRTVRTALNLEMALAPDVAALALRVGPDRVTLVPERRDEVTTEGGLDVVRQGRRIAALAVRFRRRKVAVSCFIVPEVRQVLAAAVAGSDAVELHTGAYARRRPGAGRNRELTRLREAAAAAREAGMAVYAGHGLTAANLGPVAHLPEVEELNIGHSIVARAVFVGLAGAIREIRRAMR